MRVSGVDQLLSVEHKRRRHQFGRSGRIMQLKFATGVFLMLYAVSTYVTWRSPRHPVEHVWIDNVLVEVVEEGWADTLRGGFLWCGIVSGILLWAFLYFTSPPSDRTSSSASATGAGGTRGWRSSKKDGRRNGASSSSLHTLASTIAVPEAFRNRPATAFSGGSTAWGAGAETIAATGSAGAGKLHLDATRPMRTRADLEAFLRTEQRGSSGKDNTLGGGNEFAFPTRQGTMKGPMSMRTASPPLFMHLNGALSSGTGGGGGGPPATLSDGAVKVLYESSKEWRHSSEDGGFIDWGSLGVHSVDQGIACVREWVSEVCRQLVEETRVCDEWCRDQQISAFDCTHSLQEVISTASPGSITAMNNSPAGIGSMGIGGGVGGFGGASSAMSTTGSGFRSSGFGLGGTAGGGWGGAAASVSFAPAVPQSATKLTVLLRERDFVRSRQQTVQDFDTILRFDQRLALESKLDVTSTFPQPAGATSAELNARAHYTLRRLRTFAKQKSLASFKNSGDEKDGWREGFPCDAHLLLHILRTSVEGLTNYVRFGYEGSTQQPDIALCVGDAGEPYFYIRHRSGNSDRQYTTRGGQNSLFEAVLAFAAIIHVHHQDVFRGLKGTMDLKRTGLLKVLADRPSQSGLKFW